MQNEKKIEKRLKTDFGFDNCQVKNTKDNVGNEFQANCTNSYDDTFSCQGKFNTEKGNLSRTDCEKKS